MLRYIELMCENMKGTDNRTYNTKRLAMKLHKVLKAKQPLSKEELTVRLKFPIDLKWLYNNRFIFAITER